MPCQNRNRRRDYHIKIPSWDEKVENSKFDTGYFGKYIEGVTGLQVKRTMVMMHGSEMKY